jgi:hypothetical protein
VIGREGEGGRVGGRGRQRKGVRRLREGDEGVKVGREEDRKTRRTAKGR